MKLKNVTTHHYEKTKPATINSFSTRIFRVEDSSDYPSRFTHRHDRRKEGERIIQDLGNFDVGLVSLVCRIVSNYCTFRSFLTTRTTSFPCGRE